MIIPIICTFLALLAVPTLEQDSSLTPISPCPNVFSYEPPVSEPGRWYGEIKLTTVSTLHSLWLNIVLDNKADVLANYVGTVSTKDHKNFKIENVTMRISPGNAVPVRFFVQYNPLNKTPKLVTIRLNGREICNANTLYLSRPEKVEEGMERRPTQTPNFGSETSPRPNSQRSHATEISLNIPSGHSQNRDIPDDEYLATPRPDWRARPPVSPSGHSQNRDTPDNGYLTTPRPDWRAKPPVREPVDHDYWTGPGYIQLPTLDIIYSPGEQSQCGKVVSDPIPLVVNGTPTLQGQWPWQIALYQTQTVDIKYICGGTLVTHKHVITAAHCVTRKTSERHVDPNTLMIILGKHNLRTSVEGVQIKIVKEIIVNPNYNFSLFSRDVAILELREPVTYSDNVRPACLWPDNEVDLRNVIGKKGSVVGWGLDETGVVTEELRLVEMPVVSQETCIKSYSEFFTRFTSDYTFCAGYRDGSSVCNGDSGGGMVFRKNGIWYLRGLVSLASPNICRIHYVIFTDLAKFLPWIYATVSDF